MNPIGDVQARSMIVIRVPNNGCTPKRLASFAVHCGVGISSTRS